MKNKLLLSCLLTSILYLAGCKKNETQNWTCTEYIIDVYTSSYVPTDTTTTVLPLSNLTQSEALENCNNGKTDTVFSQAATTIEKWVLTAN